MGVMARLGMTAEVEYSVRPDRFVQSWDHLYLSRRQMFVNNQTNKCKIAN